MLCWAPLSSSPLTHTKSHHNRARGLSAYVPVGAVAPPPPLHTRYYIASVASARPHSARLALLRGLHTEWSAARGGSAHPSPSVWRQPHLYHPLMHATAVPCRRRLPLPAPSNAGAGSRQFARYTSISDILAEGHSPPSLFPQQHRTTTSTITRILSAFLAALEVYASRQVSLRLTWLLASASEAGTHTAHDALICCDAPSAA